MEYVDTGVYPSAEVIVPIKWSNPSRSGQQYATIVTVNPESQWRHKITIARFERNKERILVRRRDGIEEFRLVKRS